MKRFSRRAAAGSRSRIAFSGTRGSRVWLLLLTLLTFGLLATGCFTEQDFDRLLRDQKAQTGIEPDKLLELLQTYPLEAESVRERWAFRNGAWCRFRPLFSQLTPEAMSASGALVLFRIGTGKDTDWSREADCLLLLAALHREKAGVTLNFLQPVRFHLAIDAETGRLTLSGFAVLPTTPFAPDQGRLAAFSLPALESLDLFGRELGLCGRVTRCRTHPKLRLREQKLHLLFQNHCSARLASSPDWEGPLDLLGSSVLYDTLTPECADLSAAKP